MADTDRVYLARCPVWGCGHKMRVRADIPAGEYACICWATSMLLLWAPIWHRGSGGHHPDFPDRPGHHAWQPVTVLLSTDGAQRRRVHHG
jgi:hypothetical protein